MSDAGIPFSPTEAMEAAAGAAAGSRFLLRLYTAGPTEQSTRAVVNLRALCEKHLKGRYDLEVVDLFQEPERAAKDQIIAAPTLAKLLPLPARRFIGDLSETGRILKGLGLLPELPEGTTEPP